MKSTPRTEWEEDNLAPVEAEVTEVSMDKGQVAIAFEPKRSSQAGPQESEPGITEQIKLNPTMAEQMVTALESAIGDYERRYGPIDIESNL